MASINSRDIVNEIIAADGFYFDDERVIKIVQYNNMFDGGLTYGLVYASDGKASYDRYEDGGACIDAVVLWEAS